MRFYFLFKYLVKNKKYFVAFYILFLKKLK